MTTSPRAERIWQHVIKNQPLDESIDGPPVNAENLRYISAQLVWSGGSTVAGELAFNCANTEGVPESGDWEKVGESAMLIGDSGTALIELTCLFRWIRVQFLRNTGSGGNLNCYLQGKE